MLIIQKVHSQKIRLGLQSKMHSLYCLIGLVAVLGASGEEIPGRIVGGSDAPDGKYPYQVSLRKRSHFCGGSILNDRWIMTAAHCVVNQNAKEITVVAGTNVLSSGGDLYQADLLLPHKRYSPLLLSNDIALIRVNRRIVFNNKVQPIRLPQSNPTKDGDIVTLSGWGTTQLGGPVPDRLQHIQLRVVSEQSCRRIHFIVTQKHVCTLTKAGEGACHGDSGGPLVIGNTQVGVVSFGRPCARGYPDVFTRVWSFVDWINENMANN